MFRLACSLPLSDVSSNVGQSLMGRRGVLGWRWDPGLTFFILLLIYSITELKGA